MILFIEQIIKKVREEGDKAILKYNKLFDNNYNKKFKISKKEIKTAYKKIDLKTISSLKKAAKNIKLFAKAQLKQFKNFELKKEYGLIGQKIIPIEKIGCYVPGGNYSLPSSALMSVITARAAGVKEIIVCSPNIKPVTIVAADIAGADEIFSVGGVQAIAGMAYGTKQINKVDKIVGPGNKYVTLAKKRVFGEVGIDFLAGPSEVLIIADKTGNARFIAADLLAQAEHDADSKPNLITTSRKLAKKVSEEIRRQLKIIKTRSVAKRAIKNGEIKIVDSIFKAAKLANEIAPEHLELQLKSPTKIIPRLRNYGSLFIGEYSAEVFGDYCSGTNHVLPTGYAAKYTGGLSVKDFIKVLTYQKISNKSSKSLIQIAAQLAEIEGLDAHKKAALIRLEKETLINTEKLNKTEKKDGK